MPAEVTERMDRCRWRTGEDGSDRGRAPEERAGLCCRHGHAFFDAHRLAFLEGQVHGLACDHLGRGLAQRPGRRRSRLVATTEQDLCGQGRKSIAGDESDRRAPKCPHGGPVPALEVPVHEVVMDEGEIVDELDRNATGGTHFGVGPGCLRRQDRQRGADPLPALYGRWAAVRACPAEVVTDDVTDTGSEPVDSIPHGWHGQPACPSEHFGDRVGGRHMTS